MVLHFGAVDYLAQVWLNGFELGTHEGGYTPFEFELQEYLHWDADNLLVVRVDDPPRVAHAPSEYLFSEIPHGKEDWYTRVSGIWQSVWLERRGIVDIRMVHVTPDLDNALAHVRVHLAHLPAEGDPSQLTLSCRITSPDGQHMFDAATALAPDRFTYDLPIRLDPVMPWDLHSPVLYRATVTVAQGEDPIDALTVEFGMRKVETRDNLIYLNGRPIFLIGALDQDFYPRTIFTPPSDEFLRDQFQKAKHMGLNLLRCHIKVPDPRYLEWADRLGLLVWAE
ncbi:MAG: glycoside hydrolase family 2, partial [Chloroflexota bacterium]